MMFTTLRLLLWKDLRQHRSVLIGSLVLLALPFFGFSAVGTGAWVSPLEVVQVAGLTAMFLAMVSSATVGGTAFASERTAGSADTLQLLVPRRGVRLVASWLFAVVGIAAGFGLAAIVSLASGAWGRYDATWSMSREDLREMVLVTASVNLAAFATAWAASTVLRSPAISAALGVGAAGVIALALVSERIFSGPGGDVDLAGRIVWLESALAVVALVVGSALYLRRTEP